MRDEEKAGQQMLRAKEIQMQDIAAAYKSCAEENERMSRKLGELKNGETAQYENFRKCENELIAVRFERDQYAGKQRELLEEIGTLEQHVEHLNKELERSYANYTSLQHQTMKINENQKNLKNVASIMETSQDDYRKKVANQAQELVRSVYAEQCTRRARSPEQREPHAQDLPERGAREGGSDGKPDRRGEEEAVHAARRDTAPEEREPGAGAGQPQAL